jgi:UDP-N-acetylglucosamine 2-epimerase (non-hydrolysing)
MAPVVRALSGAPALRLTVLCSGQHRDLLAPLVGWFDFPFHHDLGVMTDGQSLSALTARLMTAFEHYFGRDRPALVVAQGDTTTVMCAALSCFYLGIPFAHVEAGLRTFDLENPFPEELNRRIADGIARLHFCPTERAAKNLAAEGVAGKDIHVTGNTVIDALHYTTEKLARTPGPTAQHDVLLTTHRRENLGKPLDDIFTAVLRLVEEYPALSVLYPVHPNPDVRKPAEARLGGHPRITLAAPLDYPGLVRAMQASRIVLTDSGGIQEEAPALGKPVLVLRKVTERPEAVELGAAELVGTDAETIVSACRRLLTDADHYASMAKGVSPYGDGRAATRIRDVIDRFLRTQ